MKVLLSLAFLVFVGFASTACPVWKCENKDDPAYQGYCLFNDGEGTIHAGPFCKGNDLVCRLLEWYFDGSKYSMTCRTETTVPQRQLGLDYEYISHQLVTTYCMDMSGNKKDWEQENSCHAVCQPKRGRSLLFGKENECDYDLWVQNRQSADPNFNLGKEEGWSNCSVDGDCMSNLCECVPADDGKGRCKSSYSDKSYELYFNFVCEDTGHGDYWDNACAYWINVQLGHFINAMVQDAVSLKCLTDFDDYYDFYKVQGEIAEDTWWVYVIVILALLLLCVSCYCCFKLFKQKKEQKEGVQTQSQSAQNQPYGQMR